MRKVLVIIAAVFAMTFGINTASAATTGGTVTNMGDVNYNPSTYLYYTFDTTPDQNSPFYTLSYGYKAGPSVQGFKFRSNCRGKSQYSGSSWPYVGSVVYTMSSNNLALQLRMSCT